MSSENQSNDDSSEQYPSREVAVRVFSGELEEVDLQFREDESDDRSTKYVLLPSGGQANRVLVVGTLTETEEVSDDNWRGRIADPTGAINFYAGKYEPAGVVNTLRNAEPPHYVSVIGKPDTFERDDGEMQSTLRPESIVVLDSGGDNEQASATRARWVQETARQTLERIEQEYEEFDLTGITDSDERVEVLLEEGYIVQATEEHYGERSEVAEIVVEALETLEGSV